MEATPPSVQAGSQSGLAGASRILRRRRPSGEPPPLPRRLGTSGWYWLGLGSLAVVAWVVAVASGGGALLGVDQQVLEALARLRTPWLTRVMLALHTLGARQVIVVLGWVTVLLALVFRRLRHLFVLLGVFLAVGVLAEWLADGLVELVPPLRPDGVAALAEPGPSAYPLVPVAELAARLLGVLYVLVPQGRPRQAGKLAAAAILVTVAAARIYLAVDTVTGALVGAVIGVTIPLVAFRLLVPSEVFPVTYRRGRSAHLDVGGSRGEAIRRALEDQLGMQVLEVTPFGLAGSAGSTPLRITVKGGSNDTYLFGKLYARSHLRADRWYKLGRTLLYGRLEDEKPFTTVRRLVQQEDYALSLMQRAGLPSPQPLGVVELTPEREYLLVLEFLDGAVELGQAQIDDGIIDQGLRIVRQLWEAGLAHRDMKPANLLVRDGTVYLIDVFFVEVRPSPWRQAIDLANMLLVLALRASPQRVYERALRQFSVQEITEAFAATRSLTMPSQLRRMLRAQGRDLHAEFLALLPERPRPIPIQRWSPRRVGLTLSVLAVALTAISLALDQLDRLGLLP